MTDTVHVTGDSVLRGIDAQIQGNADIHMLISEKKIQAQELAQMYIDMDASEKVGSFRVMFKDLISMDHEVNMHTQALQTTKSAYRPSLEKTNFSKMLDSTTQQLLKSHRFDPEASTDLKKFDQAMGNAEVEDDDVVVEGGSDLPNERCPLTGKSVFELDNPIADQMGIIYEKADVVSYIKNKSREGQVVCPVSGTRHILSVKDLKPSTQLERAKRRRMMGQGGSATEHVYDADE